jgi:hypothetical protein
MSKKQNGKIWQILQFGQKISMGKVGAKECVAARLLPLK